MPQCLWAEGQRKFQVHDKLGIGIDCWVFRCWVMNKVGVKSLDCRGLVVEGLVITHGNRDYG